jgi:phage gpG-like protein
MADTLSIDIETKEVEVMLSRLLNKVERPKPLMKNIQRLVNALTKKMLHLRGKRPDNGPVRGVQWPKLKESTIKAKRAKVKAGTAIVAERPMVETGELRDTLKILSEDSDGSFVYGTRTKSKKGFNYPGFHNKGRFPFLFLRKEDFNQISKMTVDYLEEKMKSFKSYMKA